MLNTHFAVHRETNVRHLTIKSPQKFPLSYCGNNILISLVPVSMTNTTFSNILDEYLLNNYSTNEYFDGFNYALNTNLFNI